MARILYGVSGEGSGHSSRAKEIVSYLQGRGHLVKIVSYGKGYDNLRRFFEVEKIFGLRFHYENNRINQSKTLFRNALNLPQAQSSLKKIINLIDVFEPQIVFSDFEPLSCIAANMRKSPLVSIDNQHRLTNTKTEYPKKFEREAKLSRAVTNLVIFNSKACLVTTFDPKSTITNQKTFLFPPILRREILKTKPAKGNFILVYFTSAYCELLEVMKKIRKEFICYGLDMNKREGNIQFKKHSSEGFIRDLARCEGVVANAGFTLISEALFLGKPYLALPVAGQFEQIYNAYSIDKLGYGKFWEKPDREKIEAFLFNLDHYRENLKKYPKEDNAKIFKKIDEMIKIWVK
jgi:uncharacterized protein (TIGR00661 family)